MLTDICCTFPRLAADIPYLEDIAKAILCTPRMCRSFELSDSHSKDFQSPIQMSMQLSPAILCLICTGIQDERTKMLAGSKSRPSLRVLLQFAACTEFDGNRGQAHVEHSTAEK